MVRSSVLLFEIHVFTVNLYAFTGIKNVSIIQQKYFEYFEFNNKLLFFDHIHINVLNVGFVQILQ